MGVVGGCVTLEAYLHVPKLAIGSCLSSVQTSVSGLTKARTRTIKRRLLHCNITYLMQCVNLAGFN